MALKLRGQGPKTFISYAFGNTLAPKLAEQLTEAGFQVTLVVDTSLLGERSLAQALERLIQNAELVVPILDAKANSSNWVLHELTIAQRLGRVIMPIVQDERSLHDTVRDIPFLTEQTIDALIPAAISRYALLRLDPLAPYQLSIESLQEYLQSETEPIRVILDVDDYSGQLMDLIPDTVAQATENQPELRNVIESQVRKPLERCIREMDRAQPLLPGFRAAVENALQRYGPDRVKRSIAPWQRMTRLLIGTELFAIESTLPASVFPQYWVQAGPSVDAEVKKVKSLSSSHASQTSSSIWALEYIGNEATDGWIDVYFQAVQGDDFRGYIPKTQFVVDAVRFRDSPVSFFEPYQWADFGLPQLFKRALMLADRFSDDSFVHSIAWDLSEYESASPP